MKRTTMVLIVLTVLMLFVSCAVPEADYKIRIGESKISLNTSGYDWDALINAIDEVLKSYPDYEVEKYNTHFLNNRITIVFTKKP